MTLALLSGGVGLALLLVLLWLALGGLRAALEEEVVGQIRRAAQVLVGRSTRRQSGGEGVAITRQRLARLEELGDRPLSQFFFALGSWLRSIDLRRQVQEFWIGVAFLGGMDPQWTRRMPSQLQIGVAAGGAVVTAGTMAAGAVALLLHSWLFVPWAPAIAGGAVCGALTVALDRLCLSRRHGGSRLSVLTRMVPAYLVQFLSAWMVVTVLRLSLYRPEILAQAEVGRNDHVSLFDAVVILQGSVDSSLARVEQVLLTLLVVAIMLTPFFAGSLDRSGRRLSSAY